MKLESRTGKDHETGKIFLRGLALIAENEGESRLLDQAFGTKVRDDGLIAVVRGEVRVGTNLQHYIYLKK